MRTLALDPSTGDLALSAGRLTLVSGADAVAQRLRVRLKLWRGEWILDRGVGFPWQRVLGEKDTARLAESLLREAIVTCPGVRSLDRFAFTVDPTTRRASLTFAVTATTGEPVTIADFSPIAPSVPEAA